MKSTALEKLIQTFMQQVSASHRSSIIKQVLSKPFTSSKRWQSYVRSDSGLNYDKPITHKLQERCSKKTSWPSLRFRCNLFHQASVTQHLLAALLCWRDSKDRLRRNSHCTTSQFSCTNTRCDANFTHKCRFMFTHMPTQFCRIFNKRGKRFRNLVSSTLAAHSLTIRVYKDTQTCKT